MGMQSPVAAFQHAPAHLIIWIIKTIHQESRSMAALNIRFLESFMAVAETGSFSAAARQLHRSQSAVSSHVQQLEQALAVPLLERTTRSVTVTRQGKLLLARCRTALAELRSAAAELHEEAGLKRGHVSIGAVPSVSSQRLPAVLAQLKKKHPGVTIELHEGSATRIYADLRERATDFAVAPWLPEDGEDMQHEQVLQDPFFAVVPAAMAPSLGAAVTLRELARHDLLTQSQDTAVHAQAERAYLRAHLPFHPAVEVSHHQTLLAMVGAGLGVALMPGLCLPSDPPRGVRVLPLRKPGIPPRAIGIVTLKGKVLAPAAATCARMIAQALQPAAAHQPRK
jgi:DNA-binding transcriptional LysR family regulator